MDSPTLRNGRDKRVPPRVGPDRRVPPWNKWRKYGQDGGQSGKTLPRHVARAASSDLSFSDGAGFLEDTIAAWSYCQWCGYSI